MPVTNPPAAIHEKSNSFPGGRRTYSRKQFTDSSAARVTGSAENNASDLRANSAIQYEDEDINYGKAKTRQAGSRSIGAGPRMHGDVAVLRPARRQGIRRNPRARGRARDQFLRHRRRLRRRP